jgi:hypothetical protein
MFQSATPRPHDGHRCTLLVWLAALRSFEDLARGGYPQSKAELGADSPTLAYYRNFTRPTVYATLL